MQHQENILNIKRATLDLWPDTGQILGLGRNATYDAAARGEIPTIRIGRRLLVPRAALDRMLLAQG
ncbi:MAG: helix-turn-helix domain-containing protein [Bryobacteraceae bacterium]|nr:helix-turn-helix domain-containing protein [Bryobacteraceae bacterium]